MTVAVMDIFELGVLGVAGGGFSEMRCPYHALSLLEFVTKNRCLLYYIERKVS